MIYLEEISNEEITSRGLCDYSVDLTDIDRDLHPVRSQEYETGAGFAGWL